MRLGMYSREVYHEWQPSGSEKRRIREERSLQLLHYYL
jgi:hypothetical protein